MQLNPFFTFGGQYVPNALIPALDELEAAFIDARNDPAFAGETQGPARELRRASNSAHAVPQSHGRHAQQDLSQARGPPARRAHKTNPGASARHSLPNAWGKNAIIAETGAGQHGVATALVCSLMGFECCI